MLAQLGLCLRNTDICVGDEHLQGRPQLIVQTVEPMCRRARSWIGAGHAQYVRQVADESRHIAEGTLEIDRDHRQPAPTLGCAWHASTARPAEPQPPEQEQMLAAEYEGFGAVEEVELAD